MKEIPTKDKPIFVDDEDYEKVLPFNWYLKWNGYSFYAVTNMESKKVYMARFIECKKGRSC